MKFDVSGVLYGVVNCGRGFVAGDSFLVRIALSGAITVIGETKDSTGASIGIDGMAFALDFQGQSLQGADFAGANLQGADFQCANLQQADFAGALLRGADLSCANMQHADLTGATLTGLSSGQETNFNDANMQHVILTGAVCGSPNYITATGAHTQQAVDVPAACSPPL
jgi:uncharacterized protein YjbI with pentapeptide repeats